MGSFSFGITRDSSDQILANKCRAVGGPGRLLLGIGESFCSWPFSDIPPLPHIATPFLAWPPPTSTCISLPGFLLLPSQGHIAT